jgi:hypothetical protein
VQALSDRGTKPVVTEALEGAPVRHAIDPRTQSPGRRR